MAQVLGALFVVTGAFKILLWPRFFAFCAALPAQVLEGTSLETPQILGAARLAMAASSLIVPPLEVACGVLLWRGRHVRIASALLALDMLGAILTVGVPGRMGKNLEIGGVRIGGEPWRLPLEVLLLLGCAWLALRKPRKPR
jgi:uncharacterized membrane protein YphA (DoxX/SURF4 family)